MDLTTIYQRHQRQIHLDFHTSPFIGDVGSEFDGEAFADTLQAARVNSVTVFAKCHHGMCYYPTQTGVQHPALKGRDLLGEQIEALHRRGIRAPIYTTIVWEDNVALRFPQWRQLSKEGHFAGWSVGPDGLPGHVGTWQFNNPLNREYQDYIEAHLREIVARYGKEVDGFFLDILFFANNACYSPDSMAFKAAHGIKGDTRADFARFQGLAQQAFSEKFTRIISGIAPQATIFYNAQNDGNMSPVVGPRARAEFQTHNEIESLPSGFWGYFHFPRMARAQSHWGKPWLGMTGRFQKMWGDFGGIKPQPALEFECFRAQALGGGNSIGDQLPPRGTLDPAAYELIGAVFSQTEAAEPFYAGSTTLDAEVGIFSASYEDFDGGKSEEGSVQMCEESHYDCQVFDGFDDISGIKTIILPDTTVVTPDVAEKLRAFYKAGGNLILSYKSGFSPEGCFALDFLPLTFEGEESLHPSFWRARPDWDSALSQSDRVVYSAGMKVKAGEGCRTWIDRVLPYFKRTAVTYSSHFQTPPVSHTSGYSAVIAGERFVYFADPIFREFRQTGNIAVRDVWKRAMRWLSGKPAAGEGLPSTALVYPRRQDKSLLLTLLHYIPVRKAMEIDMIEERSTFAGEVLKLAHPAAKAFVYPGREEILWDADAGGFPLPSVKGRLLIEIPDYFTE